MENQSSESNISLYGFIDEAAPERVRRRYAALAVAARAADYGELDRNIVVIDTETTGLSFSHDELIQIAAARMDCGEIVDWYVTFVDPGQFLCEETVHLTGITESDLVGAPGPAEALAGLVDFVGDAKIVAHNVAFDRHFCTKHAAGYPLLENWWIDTLDLSRVALPRMKSHRLFDLVRAFDAPVSTHRADADVVATCAMLRILFAAVDAMPTALVRKIAGLATFEDWPTGRVFDEMACRKEAAASEAMVAGAAAQAGAAAEAGAEPASQQPQPQQPQQAAFSLRALRRDGMRNRKTRPARKDADDLAADPAEGLAYPSESEVARAFSPEGMVGSLYDSYEMRDEQLAMAQAVREAFSVSENLGVEAGTGVGKSMAYLVPAAMLAKRNGIAVGVATKTNALLDQLVYHELPALASTMDGLSYVPLKGISHYPCLRRIEGLLGGDLSPRLVSDKKVNPAPAMAALLSFVEQAEYDDIDGLKIDYRALPKRSITTTSHDCLRRKCPYFNDGCMTHGARRLAEQADIVVTNHSMLFCDLVADGGLLPPIRHWVIDEAHGAEAEARRAFSIELVAEDILRIANRVAAGEASRNPFIRAERSVVVGASDQGEAATMLYVLTGKAREQGKLFADAAGDFVSHMKDLLFFDDRKQGKSYEYVDLWLNEDIRASATFGAVAETGRIFSEQAEKMVRICQDLVAYLEDCENAAAVQRDIASLAMQLKEMIQAAAIVFGPQNERFVYSASLNRRNDRVTERLQASVLNVGTSLQETLYARTHSVVFATATATVAGSFEPFQNALGLNDGEGTRTRFLRLDSSFDFDENMVIFVPKDLPEPTAPSYLHALQKLLAEAHCAMRGSVLTLFTNRREMENCFDEVAPVLSADGLRLVCQKWGVSVKGLRDDFLADEHLSLFALKSFWEGFDAPGATLKGVIIPRLPFSKPSDPLSRERALRDRQAWLHYDLPAAVVETKQAVGRLIRKADDRGIVILADTRLLTKGYGRTFLNSMPSRNIRVCTCEEIVRELSRTFGE